VERVAGVFAAKEAAAKALELPLGIWLELEITWEDSGKPVLLLSERLGAQVLSSDISISHSSDHVVAVCVLLCDEDVPAAL
jgi:phosphopantetheinyl transferase (holo-ACP synthase)